MINTSLKLYDFDLQGKTHPDRPREDFDKIQLFEMASFYRATSSCMSETVDFCIRRSRKSTLLLNNLSA